VNHAAILVRILECNILDDFTFEQFEIALGLAESK
jgi:hypothetical protein